MASLKSELRAICLEIAREHPGWTFAGGMFQNKTLLHSKLTILPFHAGNGSYVVQPWASVDNKKASKLMKQILGGAMSISDLSFQRLSDEYRKGGIHRIWRKKLQFIPTSGGPVPWPAEWRDLSEAPSYLRDVVRDGIGFLNEYYDFSSEENLLRHLPTSEKIGSQGGMEAGQGVCQCIAHVLLGDFDFVEYYRSDDFKTVYPKRIEALDKIIAALPELKGRYAETGQVI
jgi:hypothetical protein